MLLFPAPDPFAILALALLIDLAFGDMRPVFRLLPHPVVIAGGAIGFFDRRLNRVSRGDRARQIRGVIAMAILVVAGALVGWVVRRYLDVVHVGWVVEGFIVAVLLAQRSLFDRVADVAKALQSGGLAEGRLALAKIAGRDPESLDDYGVARTAIESLFESFSDGVVAPAFWYLLLGLPGLFVYKTVSTAAGMIGHRTPKYLYYGWAGARFDDVLNWIPARLTGALISIAALFLPEMRSGAALRTMLQDAGKHRSPNAGWPEAAAAGALGLALSGPRRSGGAIINEAWLGDGRARVTVADIGNALKLYLASGAVLGVFVLAGAAARLYG